jgi:tRNA dimethylallyltransferase
LIDTLIPQESNSAGAHVARAEAICGEILARGKTPFLVGGTGLYFRVLFHGIIDLAIPASESKGLRESLSLQSTAGLYESLREIDPERAALLAPRDRVRILRAIEIYLLTGKTHSEHMAGQTRTGAWEGVKIVLTLPRAALRKRIAERTREMFAKGWVNEVRSLMAEGVAIDAPAMKSLGYDIIARAVAAATVDAVITRTQQYAKRQETFFRSEAGAHWIDVSDPGWEATANRLVRTCLGL